MKKYIYIYIQKEIGMYYIYMYIYIYGERERPRETYYIYMYVYIFVYIERDEGVKGNMHNGMAACINIALYIFCSLNSSVELWASGLMWSNVFCLHMRLLPLGSFK